MYNPCAFFSTYIYERKIKTSLSKQTTNWFPMFSMMRGNPVNRYILYITASFKIVDHICNPGTLYIWDVYLQSHLRKDRGREKGVKNIMQKPSTYPLYQYVHEGERKQKTWTKTITSTHHEWLFVTALFYLIMFLHSWGNHEVKEEVRGFLCSHYLCW